MQPDLILQYLISLCTSIILPASIWIIATYRVFSQLRELTLDNYQEKVREEVEKTLVERLSQILNDLFPQYGLTPPSSAPLPGIVRNLENTAEAPDRLTYLGEMYNSLVENGIQSPFFVEVVRAVLSIMGGGANGLAPG